MTDQERKAMEMVLEALEWHVSRTRPIEKTTEAMDALRQALAQPEQEPVAYADPLDLAKDGNWDTFICKHASENHEGSRFKIPLYTAPLSKPWVSLTGDEIDDIAAESGFGYINVARAIEAKLKEKNT